MAVPIARRENERPLPRVGASLLSIASKLDSSVADRAVARIGTADAPVKLVKCVDLEYPFCKSFNQRFRQLLSTRNPCGGPPTFVQFPIALHRFAIVGAEAVERAIHEDSFGRMIDKFYDAQGLRSVKEWAVVVPRRGEMLSESMALDLSFSNRLEVATACL